MIYSDNIIIPSLCPLEFKDIANVREDEHYPQAHSYVQKFGISQIIHCQFHFTTDPTTRNVVVNAYNAYTGALIKTYTGTPVMLSVGNWYIDYIIPTFELVTDQAVYFQIWDNEGILCESWPIDVASHQDTVFIAIHNTTNDFQTVFGQYSGLTVFGLCVEGGFVPDGDEDISEIETFTNQMGEKRISYAMPQFTERLVLGDSNGLPKWMRMKIMAYFNCDTVLISNVQYVRSGSWSMETTAQKMRIMSIDLTTYTNRMTQTIGGEILITNEEDTIISDESLNALAL